MHLLHILYIIYNIIIRNAHEFCTIKQHTIAHGPPIDRYLSIYSSDKSTAYDAQHVDE